jgi:hypothetical protein
MLKNLFFLVGLAAALLLKMPGGFKTNLSHKAPASINAGEEMVVDVVITKTGISGFGKYQTTLPKGFIAVPIDVKDAMFKQDDQVLKITWVAMPDGDEFIIQYRILVDAEAPQGDVSFSGRFTYLENNEKRAVTSDAVNIKVNAPDPSKIIKSEPLTLPESTSANLNQLLNESGVGCTQVSKRINENEFLINITLNKNKIVGFGKIEEPVCEGLTAVGVETAGGVFSFSENKVKFVWTDLPETQMVSVSFRLLRGKDAGWLTACSIEGEFAYLEEEKTKKCAINSSTLNFVPDDVYNQLQVASRKAPEPVQPEPTLVPPTTTEPAKEEVVTTTPVTNPEVKTEVAATEPVTKTEVKTEVVIPPVETTTEAKSADPEKTTIAPTEPVVAKTKVKEAVAPPMSTGTSVTFKVQVCATRREVSAGTVQSSFKLPETVIQEMHDGWFKFTVGGWSTYADARSKREELAPYSLPGPFVTAYNSGTRITVQEALMITKQNWVK